MPVSGYDDAALARHAATPLTTVRFSRHEIGGAAMKHVIDADESTVAYPAGIEIPTEIALRSATAPAAPHRAL
jgi:DNA-binding LacI/PurR family transcriptional regulator